MDARDEVPFNDRFLYTGWMRFRVTESGSQETLGVLGTFFSEIAGNVNPFAAGHELQYDGTADRDVSIGRFIF